MQQNEDSKIEITDLEPDFFLLKFHNNQAFAKREIHEVSKEFIQIHFSLKETGRLMFNDGRYGIDVHNSKALFLYNPNENLPINLELAPGGKFIILLISIDKFHAFFSQESRLIHFLDNDNKNKKYYTNKDLSARETVVLNDIFNCKLNASLKILYSKGKVYELLSYFFHQGEDVDTANCPFLKDENNVKKILHAKSIIIERVVNPPSLKELSDIIELPLSQLKEGFKQIYGDTVFQFLLNYKMELARGMIESKKYNVSEISYKLGYSTSSHFIAAFKNKFGTTPKKYMSNLLE